MGTVSLEAVQSLLHLDVEYPQFESYEQRFEFIVDDVTVRAIALVKWRAILIRIVDPFEITAWEFHPPLIALGIMMAHRREVLEREGKTDLDDFIVKARDSYTRHFAYLQLKPLIDAAQAPILNSQGAELQRLKQNNESVQARVAFRRNEIRRKLKIGLIAKQQYQAELKVLKAEEFEAGSAFANFKREIERKLGVVKDSMIHGALEKWQM